MLQQHQVGDGTDYPVPRIVPCAGSRGSRDDRNGDEKHATQILLRISAFSLYLEKETLCVA